MKQTSFWITNLSNRNVSLTDLNLTIKAGTTVNLLDKKHYSYTLEQLQLSATSGSLFKKNSMLVVRKVAPEIVKKNILVSHSFYDPVAKIWSEGGAYLPSRERSILVVKDEVYEELDISDEQFAADNAEIAELDTQKNTGNKG